MDIGDRGPGRAPDPVHLGEARRRVLDLLTDAGRTGLTVAEATRSLGGHPNAARVHLEGLVSDGLADSATEQPTGRGRPALRYRVTTSGLTALGGQSPANYRGLSAAFARHLAKFGDEETAKQIGRDWGERLAADLPTAAGAGEKLMRLLAALDFSPRPLTDTPGQQAYLLRTCPFLDEARANPGVICAVHLGMLEGALGEDAALQLAPFSDTGGCRLQQLAGGLGVEAG